MTFDLVFNEIDSEFFCEFSEVTSNNKHQENFIVEFGELQAVTEHIGGEKYEGAYKVTPKVTSQSLPTKNKAMTQDIVVEAIPFYVVSNFSGGKTANIGG